MASRAITREHGLARAWIGLLHCGLLDHFILRDGGVRASGGQQNASDKQAPKERELRAGAVFEKEHNSPR
jgi:hypothetical protein